MIYRFRILSNEEEDFVREIETLSDQTFLDLHHAIQESSGYDKSQLASFFITDENWEKGQEITVYDMGDEGITQRLEMDKTLLADQVLDKGQRLQYVFDFFSERGFFIELIQVTEQKSQDNFPRLIRSKGTAPQQIVIENVTQEDIIDEFDDDFGEELDLGEFDDFADEDSLF